jgi:hypothetical protein
VRKILIGLTLMFGLISPVTAQMPPPGVNGVKVGMLGCTLSPTVGLIVGSLQTVNCRYTPDGPFTPEIYTGLFGTAGIDVGVVFGGGLAWAVYAPTAGPPQGALAGIYAGPSASAGIGVGAGANILFGGSGRSFALQPVSLTGEVAVNVSVGLSSLELRWVP